MDYLASLLVFLCALTIRISVIISMNFPNGYLCFSYCGLHCISILAMEKQIDFMSAFLYWYPGMEKGFYLLSCLHCIGTLAMEKQFDSLFSFLYLVSWKWKKRKLCYSCMCCIGILAMEKRNHFPVCDIIIGILVREGRFGHSCMHLHLEYGK
jgi:hypothetical protein